MAVTLCHCSIKLLTSSDLDFIFRKLHIPVFASSKARFFLCESSFLCSLSDSYGEDVDLITQNISVSAAAVKGICASKLSGFCFDKRQVQFGVWLCSALWWVGFFPSKHLQAAFYTLRFQTWKEPCVLSYPKRSRVAVSHCFMLTVTITAKQFLVSLLLDNWEAVVGRVHGTVLWTWSISAVAAGWEGRCVHRELFQGQAEQRFWHHCLLFSEHKDLLCCRWMQDWAVPLLGMGQGPRAESLLTGFPHVPQLCPLPASHPSGREQKQGCARERSRSEKGVDIGVLQGLGKKLGIATSCAW